MIKFKFAVKEIPVQAWAGPQGSSSLRLPNFQDNGHMKVIRLSDLRAGLNYPPPTLEAESTPGP